MIVTVQCCKPSLVCDFQELYRCLIDNFLIDYCKNLRTKDFTLKTERLSRNKKAKREYLNEPKTTDLMKKLNAYFESKVDIPRIKFGKTQTIETLINEETFLFAKYLRDERPLWSPRIPVF